MVETDDPHVVLAAHLDANRDGSEPYVEIAELGTPLAMPFWLAEPAEGRVLVLQHWTRSTPSGTSSTP